MMNLDFSSYVLLGIGAAVLIVAFSYWRFKLRKTPEQRERERRQRLCTTGRITTGTVIDVSELESGKAGELQLLIYHYDVSGVSYEASQDVTHLRHLVDLHNCRIGLPASIRYDPANPGNSIVVAESWTGLRQ
ncbi:MAG TPA: DUF3592 domain-containing protein [Candidatus Saccharimonadales bacterium]|jgi:hypothetical protein|nr:DUF3592 domain-containing protein [Candidatus Saccharimonadales bacterium]